MYAIYSIVGLAVETWSEAAVVSNDRLRFACVGCWFCTRAFCLQLGSSDFPHLHQSLLATTGCSADAQHATTRHKTPRPCGKPPATIALHCLPLVHHLQRSSPSYQCTAVSDLTWPAVSTLCVCVVMPVNSMPAHRSQRVSPSSSLSETVNRVGTRYSNTI